MPAESHQLSTSSACEGDVAPNQCTTTTGGRGEGGGGGGEEYTTNSIRSGTNLSWSPIEWYLAVAWDLLPFGLICCSLRLLLLVVAAAAAAAAMVESLFPLAMETKADGKLRPPMPAVQHTESYLFGSFLRHKSWHKAQMLPQENVQTRAGLGISSPTACRFNR
ncbi:unnamed protein product [Musa acuminata subsp. burmannicoides]